MTKPLADNRRARHNYEILETHTAGLVLEGWEVKSIRAGRAQITDSYVTIKRGELFLINTHITPLATVSTHTKAEPGRSRKLLLKQIEIRRLIGRIKEKGYSAIALNLHLNKGKVKTEIALVRGKKLHDKRRSIEQKQWQRDQARLIRRRF